MKEKGNDEDAKPHSPRNCTCKACATRRVRSLLACNGDGGNSSERGTWSQDLYHPSGPYAVPVPYAPGNIPVGPPSHVKVKNDGD